MPCHALLVGHTIPCVLCVGFALQCRFCLREVKTPRPVEAAEQEGTDLGRQLYEREPDPRTGVGQPPTGPYRELTGYHREGSLRQIERVIDQLCLRSKL